MRYLKLQVLFSDTVRIIKMSIEEEFPTRTLLDKYFDHDLLERDIIGRFNLPDGKITKSGTKMLFRGEMLLFTWNTELVRIGRTDSGLVSAVNSSGMSGKGEKKSYPNYFVIDMETLKKPNQLLFQSDLNSILSEISSAKVNAISQAFNWIEETEKLEDWFESLEL